MIFLNCFKQILSGTFKEKRLIFEEPAPGAPPAATPAAPTSGPADTPEQKGDKLTDRITALKDKVKKVTEDADKDKKFTKKLVDAATALADKIKQIEDQIARLDLTAADVKAALDKFDTGLQAIEADSTTTSAFEDANLEADKALKTKVNEQREAVTAKQAELTTDAIRNAVLADIGVEDPNLKAAIGERIKDDDVKAAIDPELAAVTALLDEAEGLTGAQADAKIEAAKAKLAELTLPKIVEPFADLITEAKQWVDIVNALKALCGAGQLCLAKSKDVAKGVAEMIKDPNLDKITPKLIRDEFEEDIVLAHVGDVIGLTGDVEKAIEEIKGALRYYELGKYKKPYPNAKAEEILDKILEAKKATPDKLPGVKIDYLGGTDGTDHRLMKSKDWHSEKAAAFEKLKAFHAAGKLNGLTLTADQLKLIDEYVAAAKTGKGYEYVKDPTHKDAFLKGGGLFDAALALQRAEDMKKKIEGEDKAWKAEEVAAGTDALHIETGTTKNKKEERKSGLKFSAIVPGVDDVPYQGDVDDALRQGAQKPDHTYEIEGQNIKVTFTNPETGEPEPAKYYAVATPPEITEFKMTAVPNPIVGKPNDNYVAVEGKVNGTTYHGYLEFNPDKSFDDSSYDAITGQPNNIWEMYKPVVADPDPAGGNGTITITKKEAAPGAPTEDPNKADKERATLLGIPFKTDTEAKAEGNLTADGNPKEGFRWADPIADSKNWAVVPDSTPKIAGDKFQQILPDNLKGKYFFIENGTNIRRDKQGDTQVYSLYSDGHLETTKTVNGTEQTFVLPAGKDPDVEANWELKQAPAPKEQTNEKDHAYHIEPDGRLKVTFKGETTSVYYKIVKPDNVTLRPTVTGADDADQDQDVRFGLEDDLVWLEFDDDKKFDPGVADSPGDKYTYTAKLKGDIITITATLKSATSPPAPGAAPGQPTGGPAAAPDALKPLRDADETATQELNTTLDTAFASVNAKVDELEAVVKASEGWKTGMVQQTIEEKRKVMNETVIYTRAELEKSKKAVGEGKYTEAIDILATLASTLDTKLQEQLQADSRENFLSDASKEKIAALRAEVTAQKDKAAAAFAKRKAALDALNRASSNPQ